MSKLQKVFGPALIPDKKIIEIQVKRLKNHIASTSPQSQAKLRKKFHENNFENNVNINHDEIQVNGVKLTKSFIIDKDNKSQLPSEFNHLPLGSWMIEYQIDNDEIWKMVEKKKLNGFSIEGILNLKLMK